MLKILIMKIVILTFPDSLVKEILDTGIELKVA